MKKSAPAPFKFGQSKTPRQSYFPAARKIAAGPERGENAPKSAGLGAFRRVKAG